MLPDISIPDNLGSPCPTHLRIEIASFIRNRTKTDKKAYFNIRLCEGAQISNFDGDSVGGPQLSSSE